MFEDVVYDLNHFAWNLGFHDIEIPAYFHKQIKNSGVH